jgi:hypothetical protein
MVASHGDEASAERLLWYAVRRTAAVNLAFEVAERYSAGWFSASYFESRMRIASPLAVDAGAVAGHGSGGHTHNHHDTAPNHHDTAPSLGHGHEHHEGCECLDHEPLTAALYRRWRWYVTTVESEAAVTTFPAADERSLYERVLDRLDARAGHRLRTPSTASPIVISPLHAEESDSAVVDAPKLTITPVTNTVVIGEPIHLWVRLDGIGADSAVTVEATNNEPITVTARKGEYDALATLRPVRQPGRVEVKATLVGLGVAADPVIIDVVAERPSCPPNVGGAWEIARVDARETPKKCKAAETVSGVGSKLIGHAGKQLTGAYNSAVVGTQLCAKGANTKRCARKRVEQVKKCTKGRLSWVW